MVHYGCAQVVSADAMGVAMRLKMAKAGEAAGRQGASAEHAQQGSVRPGNGRPGSAKDPTAAALEGETHHVVQAATDMWAMGVLAWEVRWCWSWSPPLSGSMQRACMHHGKDGER